MTRLIPFSCYLELRDLLQLFPVFDILIKNPIPPESAAAAAAGETPMSPVLFKHCPPPPGGAY